jgi:ribosomal protein S8
VIQFLKKLITSQHYKKKYVKTNRTEHFDQIIPLLIKLNIVKYVIINKNIATIYLQTNNLTKIINYSTSGNTNTISIENLKKLNEKKNTIFLLSTNEGVITHYEAIKKKIGGIIILGVIF